MPDTQISRLPAIADRAELAVDAAVEMAIVYKLTAHHSILTNLEADTALVFGCPVPISPRSLIVGLVEDILILSPKMMRVEAVDVLVLPLNECAVIARCKFCVVTRVSQSTNIDTARPCILASRDVAVNLDGVRAAVDGLDLHIHIGKWN